MTELMISKDSETLNMLGFQELVTGNKFILMKENFAKAVRELRYWQQNPTANNFHSMLYNLICKADERNKTKLLTGFPDEMTAYLLWYKSTSSDDFFKEWAYLEGKSEQ
jgi:2-oxo-4-hydroxy-4-carboxy--5-ureidoimidazoline (OHCU) decarboxylase